VVAAHIVDLEKFAVSPTSCSNLAEVEVYMPSDMRIVAHIQFVAAVGWSASFSLTG
jgi:hypothetical protein